MDDFVFKIFKNKVFVKQKMKNYGFKKEGEKFLYTKKLLDSQFELRVTVSGQKNIEAKLYDTSTNDIYTLHLLDSAAGIFVGQVRAAYEETLAELAKNCCKNTYFMTPQANRLADLIKKTYNDSPEFLWEKFPGFGVFRNPESRKWYGLISNIDKSKLIKGKKGFVDILNIKLDSNEITVLLQQEGFFPAYHMNKKSWITVLLDDTVSDKKIMELVQKSHEFSEKKNKKGQYGTKSKISV